MFEVVVFIVTVTVAMAISCLCNVMEACLLSLSVTDIADLSSTKPAVAQRWKSFKENIQKPIAVILIVNTLSHTIGAALSGAQFKDLAGGRWLILYSIVFSFVMIQWTEIVPKSLAVRYNKALAPLVGRIMKGMIWLLTPLLIVIDWLNRPFEKKMRSQSRVDALSEISVLTRFAALNKLITPEQEDIVSRSIKLSSTLVKDIMVGRDQIKYLTTSMGMADALIEAHIHHHTRYLLLEGDNLDQMLGYVNFKDIVSILQTNPKNPTLKGIVRPALVIRPTERATALLKQMTQGFQHLAVVQDDKGQVLGLVTMEDLIEAIVGEIEDEYDVLPNYFYALADVRFLAGGGITLSTLRKKLEAGLPDISVPLNDWLCSLLPQAPKAEDKIKHGGLTFSVRKMRRSKIFEVTIDKA